LKTYIPIEARKGRRSACSRESPSVVVSTRIFSSASPLGFSLNSVTRPASSILSSPKSDASSVRAAVTDTVTSAPVSSCRFMKSA
jgi:hypothetical protein